MNKDFMAKTEKEIVEEEIGDFRIEYGKSFSDVIRYHLQKLKEVKTEGIKIGRKQLSEEIKERGYWKEDRITYKIEKLEYPHDERCEGSMCYCGSRAKKEAEK